VAGSPYQTFTIDAWRTVGHITDVRCTVRYMGRVPGTLQEPHNLPHVAPLTWRPILLFAVALFVVGPYFALLDLLASARASLPPAWPPARWSLPTAPPSARTFRGVFCTHGASDGFANGIPLGIEWGVSGVEAQGCYERSPFRARWLDASTFALRGSHENVTTSLESRHTTRSGSTLALWPSSLVVSIMRPFAVRLAPSPAPTAAERAAIRADATRTFARLRMVRWWLRFQSAYLHLGATDHPVLCVVGAGVLAHLWLEVAPQDQATHLLAILSDAPREAWRAAPRGR
jgi:hypothetical protein